MCSSRVHIHSRSHVPWQIREGVIHARVYVLQAGRWASLSEISLSLSRPQLGRKRAIAGPRRHVGQHAYYWCISYACECPIDRALKCVVEGRKNSVWSRKMAGWSVRELARERERREGRGRGGGVCSEVRLARQLDRSCNSNDYSARGAKDSMGQEPRKATDSAFSLLESLECTYTGANYCWWFRDTW